MLNSKSKKIGFLGTCLFHLFILFICFFSSIGYTSVVLPEGMEVQYMPYEEDLVEEEVFETPNSEELDLNSLHQEQHVEDLIVDDEKELFTPVQDDTIYNAEVELAESQSISFELENALLTLNQNSLESSSAIIEDTINAVDKLSADEISDGYILSDNRFAIYKVKPKYSCKESGTVVVRVWVNREGVTIKAEPGIRGTTESASCLFKEAKLAALQTTWTPYSDAPDIQIGQITYNFYRN